MLLMQAATYAKDPENCKFYDEQFAECIQKVRRQLKLREIHVLRAHYPQ